MKKKIYDIKNDIKSIKNSLNDNRNVKYEYKPVSFMNINNMSYEDRKKKLVGLFLLWWMWNN